MTTSVIDDVIGDRFDGGEGVARSIWVDETGQPWRRNGFANRYERLDGDDWVAGTPVGQLRKMSTIPSPLPPPSVETGTDVLKADSNIYFVKGDRGLPGKDGEKGDKGDRGEPGPPGDGTAASFVFGEIPIGVKNDINDVFSLAHSYKPLSVSVFCNGLREQRGIGFLESGTNTLTITSPPGANDVIVVDYLMA